IWSFAAMGHALARSVVGFAVARFALGLGEGGNFPAAVKTVAEGVPKKKRAPVTGIFKARPKFGPHFVAPTVALVGKHSRRARSLHCHRRARFPMATILAADLPPSRTASALIAAGTCAHQKRPG